MSSSGNGDDASEYHISDRITPYRGPINRLIPGVAAFQDHPNLPPIGSERFQLTRRRENARRLTTAIKDGDYALSTNNAEETEVTSSTALVPAFSALTTNASNTTQGRVLHRVEFAVTPAPPNQGGGANTKPTAEEEASLARDNAAINVAITIVPNPRWVEQWLRRETPPPVERVLGELPFVNPFQGLKAPVRGVIVIREPSYYVTKAEVLKILSREAKLTAQPVGSPYLAVYITMLRDTGKTGDIFIECQSEAEAILTVRVFSRRQKTGRRITLGRSPVTMEVASQEEMMQNLFPNAKNTAWRGQTPVVDMSAKYWKKGQRVLAFDGFVSQEEVNLMLKFLSDPEGTPFLSRGPHRLYDAVLTLLSKYPVWAPQYILLKDRKRIYDVTLAAVKFLATHLQDPNRNFNSALNMPLMKELIVNALTFKIFSDAQKNTFVHAIDHEMFHGIINNNGIQLPLGGTHEFASRWPWLILARQANTSNEFVRYYVKLIRDRSNRSQAHLTDDEKEGISRSGWNGQNLEPFVSFRVDYGEFAGKLDLMTLADCVEVEMSHLRRVILAALNDRLQAAMAART